MLGNSRENSSNHGNHSNSNTFELADATPHQKFSIMLQERMDDELPAMRVRLENMMKELVACKHRMVVSTKVMLLRQMIDMYKLTCSTCVDSDVHYLHCLRRDIECFIVESDVVLSTSSTDDVDVDDEGDDSEIGRIAAAIAGPFVKSLRRKYRSSTLDVYYRRLEESLYTIAINIARTSDEVLMEFMCDNDMPDLIDDDEDDDNVGIADAHVDNL
jgi:hypothetical protein